jgi:hypothetical protein
MTCSALLMCMAVSSAAWAQDGFLVFPAKDKKNATEVVAASCKYNFDKGGTQSVQCTLYAPAAPKDYSINAKETIPQPLVFVTPTAGCICYWGPNGYVCVPPSCR